MRKILSVGIVALSVCLSVPVFAAENKVAIVDVDQLFDNYEKTIALNQGLDEEVKKRQVKRDEIVADIRKLKDELVLLAEENKKEKQDVINEKIVTLQQYDEQTRQDLTETRNKYMKEILLELDEKVKAFGEEKAYDYIYNGRLLLYRKDKFDVTDELLKEINKDYAKSK